LKLKNKLKIQNKIIIKKKFIKKNKLKLNLLKCLLFKKKELVLETIIFLVYKYKLNIFLCNILNNLNITIYFNLFILRSHVLRKPKTKIRRGKEIFRKRYNLITYLFFFFKRTELLTKFFGYFLLKSKKHLRNVKSFLRFFYLLYSKQILDLKGFKLYISGKLNGNMRKRKYAFKIGEM
jgi:hypothetical protein